MSESFVPQNVSSCTLAGCTPKRYNKIKCIFEFNNLSSKYLEEFPSVDYVVVIIHIFLSNGNEYNSYLASDVDWEKNEAQKL